MLYFIAIIILFIPVVVCHPTKILHKERVPKKNKKCIVVSNHYTNWDPFLFSGKFGRKFRILAKKELFDNKFIGWILKGIGGIRIDRQQISPSAFKEVLGELNKNHQILMFPEGTRNKSGSEEMLEAKTGAIIFASKADCEIVPMILYRKPKFLRKNYIIVGEPFKVIGENPKRLTKEEIEENLERYKKINEDLRNELNSYVESKHKKNK